jgi:hypothetical protein
MLSSPRARTPGDHLSGRSIAVLAACVGFPVIALDQFLRTSPGKFSAQPATEIAHWITDSMMALPLFAVGILAAEWIAGRAGIGTARRADVIKRALLVTAACAVVMSPVWFQVDRTDDPVTAQSLVFPHASDSGDVYWVAPAVIVALACTCLVPLAAWAGHRAGRGLARAAVIAVLVAAAPAAAWLLHQAADRAYASRVYQTSALSVPPRPHAARSGPLRASAPRSPAPAAPYALAYPAAHALQDGLAGQTAGLPVAIGALLIGGRPLRARTAARNTVVSNLAVGNPGGSMSEHGRFSRRDMLKIGAVAGAGAAIRFEAPTLFQDASASVQVPQTPLPGASIAQFAEPLPTFFGKRVSGTSLQVGMFEFQQRVLPDSVYASRARPFCNGTFLWGYAAGQPGGPATPQWPGATLEVKRAPRSPSSMTAGYGGPGGLIVQAYMPIAEAYESRHWMGVKPTPSPGQSGAPMFHTGFGPDPDNQPEFRLVGVVSAEDRKKPGRTIGAMITNRTATWINSALETHEKVKKFHKPGEQPSELLVRLHHPQD